MRYHTGIYFVLLATLLWLHSDGQAQQSGTNPGLPQTLPGAITGRVISSAGEPLSGATVAALSIDNTRRPQTAITNTSGDFKIERLVPGLYRVIGSMPGYVSPTLPFSVDSTDYYRVGDSATVTLTKGGVITGTVTGPNGPLVGVGVSATRVRDETGKKIPILSGTRDRTTDDRGVFRFYGLLSGSYVIAAAKPRFGLVAPTPYDFDAPTYSPSATRDTAAEIVVREGDEVTADIQYRGAPGQAISGNVENVQVQSQFSSGVSVTLTELHNRNPMGGVGIGSLDNFSFAFYGVPDGDYELSALQFLPNREFLKSEPRIIKIRGADVAAVKLSLSPQAAIEGRIILEADPKADCGRRRDTAIQEMLVLARRYEPESKPSTGKKPAPAADVSVLSKTLTVESVADAKGSFTIRNLVSGSYRIEPRLYAGGWYVRSITMAHSPLPARNSTATIARNGITLRTGERLSGINITVTEGAASWRGHISVPEGQRLPESTHVYLVPAEKESEADVLRFFEAAPDTDGSFAIGNIAPGKYWLVARTGEETGASAEKSVRRDEALRSALLRDAGKSSTPVTLKPCERLTGYELPLPIADRLR
jgi:Carboxypeptidase regulatory-like domain